MVSLTGGRTPRALYAALADTRRAWRGRIEWPRVHLFWGDERHVPPDHPESNFGMANEALVAHVPIPPSQVHRMRGEIPDPREAARLYDEELQAAFAATGHGGCTFDVMLLGLGDDAHIASIFPESPLLADVTDPTQARQPESSRRVAGVWSPHLHAWRITLTPAALLDSAAIVMYVAGPNKADAVYDAIEAPLDVTHRPAQLLRQAAERVEWFMDAPAAGRLRDAPHA
jgi:6-phosphogluconolactonase